MAQNTESQLRDENPRQGASDTFGKPSSQRSTSRQSGRGDQEKSIQTGREGRRSTGVSQRQSNLQPYGQYGYGTTTPFSLMRRMADDMDRIFENLSLGTLGRSSGLGLSPLLDTSIERDLWNDTSALNAIWTPQVETFRRGDKIVVRADLPGLDKDDVKIDVDNGVLTISGERREDREDTGDDFYRTERSYGQFFRAIPLADGINPDDADATFKNGVLEVTFPVPKEKERKGRQIQIRG